MSQQVQDLFDDEAEFQELLDTAKNNAANDWEENFISQQIDKFAQFGRQMYLSDLQLVNIRRIARDE